MPRRVPANARIRARSRCSAGEEIGAVGETGAVHQRTNRIPRARTTTSAMGMQCFGFHHDGIGDLSGAVRSLALFICILLVALDPIGTRDNPHEACSNRDGLDIKTRPDESQYT